MRQRYKEGAIVKITLSNNKFAFGRLFQDQDIGIYDLIISLEDKTPSFKELQSRKFIFF